MTYAALCCKGKMSSASIIKIQPRRMCPSCVQFSYLISLSSSLFQWIWGQVTQYEIDRFQRYWNHHRVRLQPAKELPSGTTPQQIFDFPKNYSLLDLGVPVGKEVIDTLRGNLEKSREECFAFVDTAFGLRAHDVYVQIGSPQLTMKSGWTVYRLMLALLS